MAAPAEGSDTIELVESRWVKARGHFRHLQELYISSMGTKKFGSEEWNSGGRELQEARIVWNLVGHELQGIHRDAGKQMPIKWMTDDQVLEQASKASKARDRTRR